VLILTGSKFDIAHLAFSPDARLLAVSGPQRPFEMWDVTDANQWGRHRGVLFVSGRAAFHPTKPVCVVPVHLGVCVIETDTKKAEVIWNSDEGHEHVTNPVFAPDGETFVSHRWGDFRCLRRRAKGLHKFVWASKHPVFKFPERRAYAQLGVAAGFAPSGKVLVALDGYRMWNEPEPRMVCVRAVNAKDGKQLARVEVQHTTRAALAFAPDAKHVLTFEPMKLVLRDLTSLEPVAEVKCGRTKPVVAAFHPGGKWLAVAIGTAVKLFDCATWKPTRELDWKIGKVKSLAFSSDGALAAAAGDSGKIVVWDADA
jgi:WD40 repeat protein